LFPLEQRNERVARRHVDEWRSVKDFLDTGKGTAVDHSLLLCGLLRGFGLNAYVCLGASADGAHAWVLTCDISRTKNPYSSNVDLKFTNWKFWESLTAKVYKYDDPRVNSLYRTVGCVFNDTEYYGNVQESDQVTKTNFDLADPRLWKNMVELKQFLPVRTQEFTQLTLSNSMTNEQCTILEEMLEVKLIACLEHLRKSKGCEIDENLSFYLTEIIAKEETKQTTQLLADTGRTLTFVSDTLKSYVPKGHSFKALPMEFRHQDASKILDSILKYGLGKEIIELEDKENLKYGLRCKIYSYPEGRMAVWVVLGCTYL
jgi:centrosomal protein CEP76